jgi:hypothetical protein
VSGVLMGLFKALELKKAGKAARRETLIYG